MSKNAQLILLCFGFGYVNMLLGFLPINLIYKHMEG